MSARASQSRLLPMISLWIIALLTTSLWSLDAAEAGGQVRYAVVVGADEGLADEVSLRFAERDAARIADVLTRFGQVPEENLILLKGRSADDVTRVLGELGKRLAADEAADRESLLFFFYSGHADANELHLYGSRLPLKELKSLVDDSQAKLRVMVVDACRSGALTRLKGATPAEPFAIDAEDRLASEGMAIITSSAPGEDAQESDQIKGGIFTHHFIGGLLGAADASSDQRVTLNEAYRYAYEQTLRSTSRARFVQHPTYSFRMRGREDLVLTRLKETRGLGRMALQVDGRYLLLPQDDDGRVVELSTEGRTLVLLEPGQWLVRRRTDKTVYEARQQVSPGETTEVMAAAMSPVPFGQTVRRGDALSRQSAWVLTTGFEAAGSYQTQIGPTFGPTLGLRVDLAPVSLEARVRWGRTSSSNTDVDLTQDTLGFDLGALKLYDVAPPVALGFGVRLGVDAVNQRFETTGSGPARTAYAGRLSPVLRAEWNLAAWLTLGLEAGADMRWVQLEGELDASFNAVPVGGLTLGGYLP
ncbi:MAG: caspase domain-containing protein [Bradymonadia bacterium]